MLQWGTGVVIEVHCKGSMFALSSDCKIAGTEHAVL
jgi:hypothetical protein